MSAGHNRILGHAAIDKAARDPSRVGRVEARRLQNCSHRAFCGDRMPMLETKTTRKSKVKSVWGVPARGAGSGAYEPGCERISANARGHALPRQQVRFRSLSDEVPGAARHMARHITEALCRGATATERPISTRSRLLSSDCHAGANVRIHAGQHYEIRTCRVICPLLSQ